MHAAVVRSFDTDPKYEIFDTPVPRGANETVIDVLAAGFHPRVRSQADGTHYTSTHALPLIPGIDGVGRLPDGKMVYFVALDSTSGTFAEKAIVDVRQSVPLPTGIDPVRIAAAMNPAMSSWVAFRRQVDIQAGQKVLVLGATGNAGQMAVQIAKLFGASQVIGAGRDPERLRVVRALGADEIVSLAGERETVAKRLGEVAAEVDIVIDYLWGPPTEQAMMALLTHRADKSRMLSWVQIGSMAGPHANVPSALLRAANLHLLGCGQGAVSTAAYVAELPALVEAIAAEQIAVSPAVYPLAEVAQVWRNSEDHGQRVVFLPQGGH